jgi:hypothetical protein
MADPAGTLIQAAFQVCAAALYAWVASLVYQRELSGEGRRANALFATWWLALGLVLLLAPLYSVPPVLGYRDLALAVTLLNALLLLIVVAIWGLVYYLVYLYTGNARWFWPLTVAYGTLAVGLLYLIAWADPTGFEADGTLHLEHELVGPPAVAFGLLFSLPIVVAALAYGSLFFRVADRGPRYRIAMVAGAFLFQFGWSTVSNVTGISRTYRGALWLQLLSDVITVLVAVVVVMAFRPPRAIRQRLGLPEPGGT